MFFIACLVIPSKLVVNTISSLQSSCVYSFVFETMFIYRLNNSVFRMHGANSNCSKCCPENSLILLPEDCLCSLVYIPSSKMNRVSLVQSLSKYLSCQASAPTLFAWVHGTALDFSSGTLVNNEITPYRDEFGTSLLITFACSLSCTTFKTKQIVHTYPVKSFQCLNGCDVRWTDSPHGFWHSVS